MGILTLSVTSPDSITLPSLVPGNLVESSLQLVTVSSNTNWSLTVAENGASPDGKMEKSGEIKMVNPIEAKGGEANYTSLAAPVTLKASGSGTIPLDNISFRQQVASNDAAGVYSITVIFTATPLP